MKVLFYAWDIYDKDLLELQVLPNGGSIAIRNIIEYVGRKQEVYLFIGKKKLPAQKLHHINIVNTEKYSDCKDRDIDTEERWLRTMQAAFRRVILEIKPDIVNLHGGGALIRRCILVCKEMGVKYAYTNHLYIGKDKEFIIKEREKKWEREIFSIPNLKITTVGTTSRQRILTDYKHIKETDIDVILNGTDFVYSKESTNLIEKLDIKNKKILLCCGTIIERKNQLQLVHAFKEINERDREDIVILFCGKDRMDGALQREIDKYGLQNNLKYLGVIPNDEMKQYYSIANGYILISLAEGLSLTMLEAMVFGLPLIMFDDIEGATDLNDEKISIFIKGKRNIDIADAIATWKNKIWDKAYIQQYATYFNLDRVADDYIKYYKKRLEEN